MYFVITQKFYKIAQHVTEQYAARSTNRTEWAVHGPFTRQSLAERALSRATGTANTLHAFMVDEDKLRAMDGRSQDYNLDKAIRLAINYLPAKEKTAIS